jgi:predicted Rossmann fold flavoprotein
MRVAVVGGGAAGFFAAVNAAEKNPKLSVIIFEAGQKPLQKVFISGGGRCNVTHDCFEVAKLVEFYPRGGKALYSLFSRFQPKDTLAWFQRHGLKLKREQDGRMFPVSDSSQDVIDVFLQAAQRSGIILKTNHRILSISKQGRAFCIETPHGAEAFDKVVLATGYSPPGWAIAQSLGHTILTPVPSLFPFKVQSSIIAGLQGISMEDIEGKLKTSAMKKPVEANGDVLITHTGLSGPVIYRLSAKAARELSEASYQAMLTLDLLPKYTDDELKELLKEAFHGDWTKKKMGNTRLEEIPNRFWLSLLESSGITLEARGLDVPKAAQNKLLEHLKRLSLPVSGKSPSKEEFVSCGGVKLSEVDFKTMESKICPGLYLGGEILDIDGLTGGFNFQACWSAGWIISESLKN